jgi:hypothetical protein
VGTFSEIGAEKMRAVLAILPLAFPTFYRRMKPVYDDYLAHSNPVATSVTIPWAYRLLFSKGWVKQAF